MDMLRAILLLLLLWFGNTDAGLFTSSNPSVVTSYVTLFSNTTSIDNTPSIGSNVQTYDHNIVPTNSTQPDASGLSGILYDRQQSCQQDTTDILPELLQMGQPKIALVKQGGGCSLTDKAYYSQRDNAIAVIVYANVPFDNVNTLSVGDMIKIPVYYVDLELGQTLFRLLQQPDPISQAPLNNVTYQPAIKVTLYPFIGGFPTAWEFILIIVVALLALSFLVSMGMHWHLWRIRRRQRTRYETGLSMTLLPGRLDKKVLDPASLGLFPTRIVGQDNNNHNDGADTADDDTNRQTPTQQQQDEYILKRRPSVLSLRTEKALENAEALAATIVHSKHDAIPPPSPPLDDTTSPTATALAPSTQQQQQQQQEEGCVICLDEFSLGDNVRKLPCGHEYHCECIDPWLTIKSASCPLCKHDCLLDIPKQQQEMETDDDDNDDRPSNQATPSPPSSLFSLSFLRRRMDEDDRSGSSNNSSNHHRTPPGLSSSFGPTIPADQAEAFSRSWMARSLPRNMRRQIDLAVQQAAEAHRQEHMVVDLPARMVSHQEPVVISADTSATQPSTVMDPETLQPPPTASLAPASSSSSSTTTHLFSSLPRQWRRKT